MRAPHDTLIERLREDAASLPGPRPGLAQQAVRAALQAGGASSTPLRARLPAAGAGETAARPTLTPALAHHRRVARRLGRGVGLGLALGAAAAAALLLWVGLADDRSAPAGTAPEAPLARPAHAPPELLAGDAALAFSLDVEAPLRDEVARLRRQATTTGSFLVEQLFTPLRSLRLTPQLHDGGLQER